ncbi:hypothetical protein A2U01_0107405, partial [Trifolium medium]|nr:hypothetical protein [Trifolium medium]
MVGSVLPIWKLVGTVQDGKGTV